VDGHVPQCRSRRHALLEAIQGLDLSLRQEPDETYTLHCHKGDSCTPDSYEPFDVTLTPATTQVFASAGGRPTNGQFPYYNLQVGNDGTLLAVGWPGQWASRFAHDEPGRLRISAGQELTHLVLHPARRSARH